MLAQTENTNVLVVLIDDDPAKRGLTIEGVPVIGGHADLLAAAQEAEERLAKVQEQVEKTLEEARAQAREILNRSHGEATAEAQEVIAKARADAEALIERARVEIGGERDRAIQDLRNEVASLVIATTERLLGDTLDAKAHQRLIDGALANVVDNPAAKAEQN